ncbi:MAG: phosphatidylserine decarboxylase [Candidatus Sumerlaeia bacterium]
MAEIKRREKSFPLDPAGWAFIIPFLLIALVLLLIGWTWAAGIVLILGLCVGAFFRDPRRTSPQNPQAILSPADGKVVGIEEMEVECPENERKTMLRVSIFLSVFDVHVQRSPWAGTVKSVVHTPGKFRNAMSSQSSIDNENTMIWFNTDQGWVGVRQIAGLVARRVVTRVEPGDQLEKGAHIGMIRFGSRVELFFSPHATVRVQNGQYVKGGISIMAEWQDDESKNREGN